MSSAAAKETDISESHEDLEVRVNLFCHVEKNVAPMQSVVHCPLDATVQDLLDLLSKQYGAEVRSSLTIPRMLTIVNGVPYADIDPKAKLRKGEETAVEVTFLYIISHGG